YAARPTGTAIWKKDPAASITTSGNGRVTRWPSSWNPRSTRDRSGTCALTTKAIHPSKRETPTPIRYFQRLQVGPPMPRGSAGRADRVRTLLGEVLRAHVVQKLSELLDLLF